MFINFNFNSDFNSDYHFVLIFLLLIIMKDIFIKLNDNFILTYQNMI
jgi:hypothetical protein